MDLAVESKRKACHFKREDGIRLANRIGAVAYVSLEKTVRVPSGPDPVAEIIDAVARAAIQSRIITRNSMIDISEDLAETTNTIG